MDFSLPTIAAFNVELLDGLDKLRATWNRNIALKLRPSFPVDDYIEEIKKAAEPNILFRARMSLNRLDRGDAYEGDIVKFATDLINTDYIRNPEKLKFVKLSAGEGTDERKESLKFLNEFANHVGKVIDSRHNPAHKTVIAPAQPDWTKTGLIPTEHVVTQPEKITSFFRDTVSNPPPSERSGITVSYVPSDSLTDTNPSWGIEGTPKPIAIDDLEDLKKEAADIAEMVKKAIYSDQLRSQIETTLKPRLEAVNQELGTRYSDLDATNRTIFNQPLIDFRNSLATFIQQGLARADLLEQKALNAPKAKVSKSLAQREEALRSGINEAIEKMQGANLQKFLDAHLMPKSLSLKEEITALRKSGADVEIIFEKVRNLKVIQDSMATATRKLDTERAAHAFVQKFVAPVVVPPAVVVTPPESSIASNKPPAHIKTFPSLTEVIESPNELLSKVAFLAPNLMKRTLLPQQPKATIHDERPWEDTVPTLTEAVHESAAIPALQYKAHEITRYRSPNVLKQFPGIDLDKGDSETSKDGGNANSISDVQFRMREHPPIEPRFETVTSATAANNQSFWRRHFKKAAVGISGALVTFAIAAGMWSGGSHAPDAQSVKKDATPEPTAQVVQHEVVQQPTIILAAAPANDVAPVPVAEVAAPEATIEAAPVAPTVTAKAPKILHHFAKAKVAAPTVDVQDNTPLVEKTWDIATSRVDLETWNNACKALNQHNLTVSGVCPQ